MTKQENRTKEALEKNRKIAETGVFLALFLGLAYAFSYVPNLEYITAVAFLSGLMLGWKRGLFVALIGEAVFSIANPFGSSLAFPTLLAAQLISYGIFALLGAAFRSFLPAMIEKRTSLAAGLLGLTGFCLTIFYNIMTTVFYAIPSGFSLEQTLASIVSGIPFYLINMIANTITFSVLISLILKYVIKNYPHYFKGRS